MFIDTHAWFDYFEGNARGVAVKERLDGTTVAYTSPMVLAELTSKYTRALGPQEAKKRVDHVLQHCVVVDHTREIGIEAGNIHAEMKPRVDGIGLADCFILASARSKGVRVLTGDPHFEGVPDADML